MSEECRGLAGDRLPRFDLGEGALHPAAETRLRTRHLKLALKLFPEDRRFEASVELTFDVAADGLDELTLDATELEIRKVQVDGQDVAFEHLDHRLRLMLRPSPQRGRQLRVRVDYAARPRFGLFFLEPDDGYPDRPTQVWTQGQDDYTRYWLPCLDAPNQKATSEVVVDAPEGWEVISNGRLVDVATVHPGRRRFHWSQEVAHSPYLISVVAGEFASWHEEVGGVRFSYHVPRGREADGRRALGRTPEMVELFARLTGVPYPFAKYAQACVADFIFGGMENSSATTLTDRTLHDARGNLDQTSEPLVAHELAHQWFGDLVTCRAWSHGWLNEGFATYFEHLWTEHAHGREEFDDELLTTLETYLEEDGSRYRRPVVEERYVTPAELFDRHLYQKGAFVLHQLRRELGDQAFFGSLKSYLETHRGGAVETIDLARAIERATGRNLDPFFAQWIFRPGHPELEAKVSVSAGQVTVRVCQTQAEGPFAFPLRIAVEERGGLSTFDVRVAGREERFDLPVKGAPSVVSLDPELSLLATWSIEKPEDFWVSELRSPRLSSIARSRAAVGLAKAQVLRAIPALRDSLLTASFWGEQARAAAALGELRGEEALAALAEAVTLRHPKARRAVAKALGKFRVPRAVELLRGMAKADASYLVEGEALKSLALTRQPGVRDLVIEELERESDHAVIRRLALEGLGESGDAAALPAVRERLGYGEPVPSRVAATSALGRLGRDRPDVVDTLTQLLEDPDFYVRLAACDALARLGDTAARSSLERLARRDPSGRVQRAAREAMARLSVKGVEPWRAELEGIQGEVARLRAEVSRLAPARPSPPPRRARKGRARRA